MGWSRVEILVPVPFRAPPAAACWQHLETRTGFEVAYFQAHEDGWYINGTTAAVEDGQPWDVTYAIRLDADWSTRSAHIAARFTAGTRETSLQRDGTTHWLVDGALAPHLDGCLDVDLESSALTNSLPIRRLGLSVGARAAAPAAYVRAPHLAVERLEQAYARIPDDDLHQRYDYSAPAFNFACRLVYDEYGLVLDYPRFAVRAH